MNFLNRRWSRLSQLPWWYELPEDLKEKALAWLPAESLCKYRAVSKEWNDFLSSTKFITNDWVAAPPNNKPWLVVCHQDTIWNCMAHCFYRNTWKRFSLDFLGKKYLWPSPKIHGSAAGLLLVSVYSRRNVVHTVSNPLTETSLELPQINNSTIKAMTLVSGEGHDHNVETYKVIAVAQSVAQSRYEMRVQIYDSSLKSWSTTGRLPQNVGFPGARIVIAEDILYCWVVERDSLRPAVVAFSVQNGTSIFMPLPLENLENWNRWDFLFTCGARVLLATCIRQVNVDLISDIIIWEIEKPELGSHRLEVREIARIPPSVLEDLKRKEEVVFGTVNFIGFEGLRDLVCIAYGLTREVLVYNLIENTWRWLERLSVESGSLYVSFFSFEPRPDMKVE